MYEKVVWEYLVLKSHGFFDKDDLNARGDEGWELISVIREGSYAIYHFKRKG